MDLTDMNVLRPLLEEHGFHFSRALGQNFLTAPWVPEQIIAASGVTAEDGVLELGPGVGALTTALAGRARAVTALELDKALAPVLTRTLAGLDNVTLRYGDALKTDLAALCRETLGAPPWQVCANIPYNITTPLLTALLEAQCFQNITVMVQREVAERLCAPPGAANYSAFTVTALWYARPERLFDVPPDCFFPQPKVTSSVLRLRPRTEPAVAVRDAALLLRVVRAAFAQRRKTLPNALCAALPGLAREDAAACLTAAGLDPRVRGEALSLPEFARVSDELLSYMQV